MATVVFATEQQAGTQSSKGLGVHRVGRFNKPKIRTRAFVPGQGVQGHNRQERLLQLGKDILGTANIAVHCLGKEGQRGACKERKQRRQPNDETFTRLDGSLGYNRVLHNTRRCVLETHDLGGFAHAIEEHFVQALVSVNFAL